MILLFKNDDQEINPKTGFRKAQERPPYCIMKLAKQPGLWLSARDSDQGPTELRCLALPRDGWMVLDG
jgi:hypothetical protein